MPAALPAGPIACVARTGSTSEDLAIRIRAGDPLPDGAWLVADRQEAGRGRLGRAWLDAPGNFMGSTTLVIRADDPPLVSLGFVAGLAVFHALIGHGAPAARVELKWPNDVLLDGCKLAGILLERVGGHAVIGIGANLVLAPAVAGRPVAALAGAGGGNGGRDGFARELAGHWAREVRAWREAGEAPVFRRWLGVAHALGTRLGVHEPDGAFRSGVFAGLAEDGALRLRLADGTTHTIRAGDVMLEG